MKRISTICLLCTSLLSSSALAQSAYTLRYIVCVPAARQAALNSALEAAGYGPGNLSIPIIPLAGPDVLPPTFYCADWPMTPAQYTEITGLLAGQNPVFQQRQSVDPREGATFDELIAGYGWKVKPGTL